MTVKVEQHKTGRSITGFSFSFKQKKSVTKSAKSIEGRSLPKMRWIP
ncbi:hypothetical protein ACTXQV_59925 [Klebsiella pneumoniae]